MAKIQAVSSSTGFEVPGQLPTARQDILKAGQCQDHLIRDHRENRCLGDAQKCLESDLGMITGTLSSRKTELSRKRGAGGLRYV